MYVHVRIIIKIFITNKYKKKRHKYKHLLHNTSTFFLIMNK